MSAVTFAVEDLAVRIARMDAMERRLREEVRLARLADAELADVIEIQRRRIAGDASR